MFFEIIRLFFQTNEVGQEHDRDNFLKNITKGGSPMVNNLTVYHSA